MTVVRTYGLLWAATGTGALLTGLGIVVSPVSPPHDALDDSVATAASIVRNNVPIVLLPIVLTAVGWGQHRSLRLLGDAVVLAQLLGHGLLVGSALGQHHDAWRFLTHLPVEWLALALGAAGWVTGRTSTTRPPYRRLLALAVLAGLAAVVAAVIETWAVPL